MKELTAQATIKRSRMGVMPFPRGDYSSIITDYCWNDSKRDLVYYNKLWYAVKKFDPFNPVPKGSVPSSSSAYWELATQFNVLVAGSVLAEHLAAGAITVKTIKDAINKEALNINDNFIIDTNGVVTINNGSIKTRNSKDGSYAELNECSLRGYGSILGREYDMFSIGYGGRGFHGNFTGYWGHLSVFEVFENGNLGLGASITPFSLRIQSLVIDTETLGSGRIKKTIEIIYI